MHSIPIAAPLLATLAGLTAQEGPRELRFEVAPGTELLKTLTYSHGLRIAAVSQMRTGAPPVRDPTGGWVEAEQTVVVRDRYERVADGLPTSLLRDWERAFGKALATLQQGPGPRLALDKEQGAHFKVDFFSPLVPQGAVVFEWIEEEGDWGRMYDTVDGPESYLAELDGDFDLLALLPAGPVAPGDTWEVPPERVPLLLAPGGDSCLWPKSYGDIFARNVLIGVGGNVAECFPDDAEVVSHATCTYRGTRTVDGLELGVIEVQLDVTSFTDRTRRYELGMPDQERASETLLEQAVMQFELRGTGEALWSLDEGRLHSWELVGQQRLIGLVTKTGAWDVEAEDETGLQLEEQMEMEGDLKVTLQIEPAG